MSYMLVLLMSFAAEASVAQEAIPEPPAYMHDWTTQQLIDGILELQSVRILNGCMQLLERRGAAVAPDIEASIWKELQQGSPTLLVAALSRLPLRDPRVEKAFLTCIDLSRHGDSQFRCDVVDGLHTYGDAAVPFLLSLLQEANPNRRRLAAQVLYFMDPEHPKVIPALEAALLDADIVVVAIAADALKKFEAIDSLNRALTADSEWTRLYAVASLWRLHKKATPARETLESIAATDAPHLRIFAALALQRINFTQESAYKRLLKELQHPDPTAHLKALKDLHALYEERIPAQNILTDLLYDEDAEVRWKAAYALSEQSEVNPECMEALLHALRDTEDSTRSYAAETLSMLGCQAFPGALEVIENGTEEQRETATGVFNITEACPKCAEYVPQLREALHTVEDGWARSEICVALEHIGPAAAEALPELWHLTATGTSDAYMALVALGDVTVQAAMEAIHDEEALSRALAFDILEKNDKLSPEVMALLMRDLETDDDDLLRDLLGTLSFCDQLPATLVPRFVELIEMNIQNDNPHFILERLFGLLAKVDPPAVEALPVLKPFLEIDRRTNTTVAAVRAIEAIAPGSIPVEPPLTGAEKQDVKALLVRMRKQDTPVYREAHDLLTAMGSEAHEALWDVVHNGPDEDRGRAAWRLHVQGVDPEMLGESVAAWMESDNAELRAMVVKTQLFHGLSQKSKLSEAYEVIARSEGRDRIQAMHLLSLHGPATQEALPMLCAYLKADVDHELRFATLEALRAMGPEAEGAVPLLCDLLRTEDRLSGLIMQVLQAIGPPAKSAIPLLLKLLEIPEHQESSCKALKAMGPEAAEAALPLLEEEDFMLRIIALQIISSMGPLYKNNIIAALEDPAEPVRMQAMELLKAFPEADNLRIEKLLNAIRIGSGDIDDHRAACYHLGEVAVPGLIELLNEPDPPLQIRATQCLDYMGARAREALPALLLQLGQADLPLRNAILEALEEITDEMGPVRYIVDDHWMRGACM